MVEKNKKNTFEEEIKKPYYRADYLDDFKLPYEKLDVSIVIATYNRCPYKKDSMKEDYNPLVWAIKTSLLQKPKIKEIIIVNDASTDYTQEIISKYKEIAKKQDVLLSSIKTEKRVGPGIARNIGSQNANAKFIHFVDDDCFIAPYAVFGAVYTFDKLTEKGNRVGAINLPTYQRASIPGKVVPKKDIGYMDLLRGIFKANKEAFPEEYLNIPANEKYLDAETHILNPYPILNINTTSLLCLKSAFQEIGGFRQHFINRGEDRELGAVFLENGYQIYFQPDPKFHCVHGSYGLKLGKKFDGEDWFKNIDKSISLKKAMEVCDKPAEDSGTRVNHDDYIYQTMLANFYLTYTRSKRGAINWIKKSWQDFVVKGNSEILGNSKMALPDSTKRKQMWLDSIRNGLGFIKKEEKQSIKKIEETIKQLKKDEELGEEAIGKLSKTE